MERKFRITVDGHAYTVTVEEILQIGPAAQSAPDAALAAPAAPAPSATPAVVAAHRPATSHGPAAEGDVVATLTGIVESIPVSVGQAVEAGQPVVVVEAMKMKSPMVAPRAGKVASITVAVGQGVDPGQVLASIA